MVDKEYIDKAFEDAINDWIIKCGRTGSRPSSGIIYGQGEAPTYELVDGGLTKDLLNTIADDMAKRWGLEVSIDAKGKREIAMNKFKLWDEEHQTLINLGKIIKHQDWIDFTNGNGNVNASYTLDDVLRYYTEMNDIAKTRTSAVIFETNSGASMNREYNGQYGLENTIEISNMVYGNRRGTNVPSEYHLKQVLAHEAGHASERILTRGDVEVLRKSCIGKNKFSPRGLNSAEEKRYYTLLGANATRGRANAISYSKEYETAMSQNKVRFASDYAKRKHGYGMGGNSEDFAETMSAVAYRNSSDKSNFRITYPDGKVVGYDEFVRDHEATFKICCDYVDGKISHTDLHHPVTNEKFT